MSSDRVAIEPLKAVAFEKTLVMNRIRPMSSINRKEYQSVTFDKPERVMSAKMLKKVNNFVSPTMAQEKRLFVRKSSPP